MAKSKAHAQQKRRQKGEKKHYFLAQAVIGGIIGLIILAWLPVTVLTCRYAEATRVDCRLQQRLLGLVPLRETRINNLQSAYLEWASHVSRSRRGRIHSYQAGQVMLVSPVGVIPLNWKPNTDREEGQATVNRINAYLNTPGAGSLSIWEDYAYTLWLGSCLGFLAILWLWAERVSRQRAEAGD